MNIDNDHITGLKRHRVVGDGIIWEQSTKEDDADALISSLVHEKKKMMCIESPKSTNKKLFVRKRSFIELQSQNTERWKRIQDLQKNLNGKKQRYINQFNSNIKGRSSCNDWVQNMELAALKFEVERIRKRRNNRTDHEKHDEFVTQKKSKDFSQSIVHYARVYHSTIFPNEIINSYQELSQLHATLDRVIPSDEDDKDNSWSLPARIHHMKRNIQYQEKLNDVLTLKQSRSCEVNEKNNSEKPTNDDSMVIDSSVSNNSILTENEQVRNDLKYVTTMLQKKKQKKSLKTNSSKYLTKKESILVLGPRNTQIRNNTKKDSQPLGSWYSPENSSSLSKPATCNKKRGSDRPLWSLDRLILQLANQSLRFPNDPYLMYNNLEKDSSDLIDKHHVKFLLQCGVIQTHEQNSNLITMIDYNNN